MGGLSDVAVGAIRSSRSSTGDLASRFGISEQAVRGIKCYRTYRESSKKARQRGNDIFEYAKRRRLLETREDVAKDTQLADEEFEAEDAKHNRYSLSRFMQHEILYFVGNRSFWCRPGTSDVKSAQESAVSYRYLFRHLPNGPVTVVDAGCNIAGFSVFANDRLSSHEGVTRFFAYEPISEHCSLAKKNLSFNGFKINLKRAALGKKTETAWINRPNKLTQKYRDSLLGQVTQKSTAEKVNVLSVEKEFSNWAKNLSNGSLLVKIDVEGYEIIVVKELLKAFTSKRRDFSLVTVIEFSHDFHTDFAVFRNCVDLIKRHGATDLRYDRRYYGSAGVWKPRCANSGSIIKFGIIPHE